ncbi:TldD/PmbA family protein [Bacillota bacterium LX-D]|nr:TldD/PmbA family protein [Bacillota bacterium LX-D]
MLSRNQLSEVLQTALQEGGDFAEIYIERKMTSGITCEANKIERVVSGGENGAGVRVINGDNTMYAFTNDITLNGLNKIAEAVSKAVKNQKKSLSINLIEVKPELKFPILKRPEQVKIDDKVEIVQRCDQYAREVDSRIKQVTVSYGDVVQNITIANSLGNFVEDERIRTRLVVNAIAVDKGNIQTGYESMGGFSGFEYFDKHDPAKLAKEAAQRAISMLSAKPAPAGKMPVVMAGEAGGTMVHEACGHGLEADLVQKKLSVYAGKKGQEVASKLVTVVDDATLQGKYGSFRFDDEGMKAQKTVLIKDGILEDYMYDRLTAKKDGKESTGNGRRESYQNRPITRMTNTYIASGKMIPDEIIKSTSKGLLVKKMGGGQVNTTTGDFVFDVTEGYLIKDGQVAEAVKGATLTGNGPNSLKMVDMIGNDLGFGIGVCGKDGQGVPVTDAQPTLRIPELIVGGLLD